MKYLRLYKVYFSKSLKSRLSYKLDAIIGILGFLSTNAIMFSTLFLTISSIPSLNGWTINQLGFLYGFYLIPKALDHILSDNIWQMANGGITRGMFDKYLLRPISPLFQLVAETVQLEGLGEFILGFILISMFGANLNLNMTFLTIIALALVALFGMMLFFSIKLLFGSISFWTKRSIQIMSMVYNLSDFSKYPIDIFGQVIKVFLLYIIPFSMVLFNPISDILNGKNPFIHILYSGIAASIFLCLALFVWIKGIKRYESAGS